MSSRHSGIRHSGIRHSGTGLSGLTSSMRLQEARDRLYSVVDHMIDGIVTFDDGGSIESANPAAQAMFAYAANELVGQSVKILMPVLNKMPHESVAAHLFADGGRREIEGRRKDDTTFPIDLAVSEFRHEGGRYFTAIVRDITERKRGEERTRFLALGGSAVERCRLSQSRWANCTDSRATLC